MISMSVDSKLHFITPGKLRWIGRTAGVLLFVTGVMVLIGWAFNVNTVPGLLPIAPNTTVGFLLAGLSLWLLCSETVGSFGARAAQIPGLLVMLIGALTLGEYLFGWRLGIDHLFFRESVLAINSPGAGRPAFLTAFNFFCLGWAVLLLDVKGVRGWLIEVLIVVPIEISLLALIGYACGVPSFYGWNSLFPNTAMSLHSTVAFTVLGTGLLCARPERNLMKVIASRTGGGVVARRLLLAPVIIPLSTGLIRMAGARVGLYNSEFAGWLFSFANIFFFTAVIWWIATLLFRAESVRVRAEDSVRQLNAELEQRVAERTAELGRQRGELQLIFDTVPAIVFYKDVRHRLLRVNEAAARCFGLSKEELEGRTDEELGAPHAARYYQDEDEVMSSGQPKLGIIEPVETTRGTRWWQTDKFPYRDETGQVAGVIGFALDITERMQAEEEIHKLNAELEQRVSDRTAKLEAANKELEAFSYSVSHDLRSPLRAVDGFSQVLMEDCGPQLSDDGRRYLKNIRDGAQRMGALIDDLLAFSRLSRMPLNKRRVDTAKLVKDTREDIGLQHGGRQIEVRVAELPLCWGDPALLKQVWINLLSNAFKYTRRAEVAIIEVGCFRENDGSVYFVRDNGTGFDMRYADKLFGVFQRLHRAEDYEGTGVGLAIVQRIIHRHGGRIWAESELNRGATFHFTLEEETKL
jgi:PAS domain S-box-containing protein